MRDILWKVRRETLAVVVLQQGFPTQLSAEKRVHKMLDFHVRRVYYQFYGIRGNSKSLSGFAYRVGQLFYKWLNRRGQRKSYNVVGFNALIKDFELIKPRICHDF